MNEEKTITYELIKSDLQPNAWAFLSLLVTAHPNFLAAQMSEDDDGVTLTYQYPSHHYLWEDIKRQKRSERLRTLANIAHLRGLLHSRYTFELSPENLVFTHNHQPQLIKRGVKGAIPPVIPIPEADFLRRCQAMAIDLFSKDTTFEDLMGGTLATHTGTPFDQDILQATSIEEWEAVVDRYYVAELFKETRSLVETNRQKLFWKHVGLAVSSVAAIILAVVVIYQTFIHVPLQEKLIQANEHYLRDEYSHVVTTLGDVAGEQMPRGTKYAMAYSVIQTEPLSQTQKNNLLDQLSVQMNEDYLLYWTEIGKGNHDEALDIATYLDEPQIMIYALSKKIEEIQSNPNLSSEERTTEMDRYQNQLNNLNEAYNTEPEG